MSKIETLTTITSGYLSNEQISSNFDKITTAMSNTVSRDGSSPNTITANIDMNSKQLINLVAPTSDLMAATKKYVDDNTSSATIAQIAIDAATTNANVILTNADVVSTHADVVTASEWATKTSGQVSATDYSSKAYAIGGTGTTTNNAKYYSEQAAISAASINLPTVVAGSATKLLKVNAGETGFEFGAKLPNFTANTRGTLFVQNGADDGFEAVSQGTSGQVFLSAGADALPVFTSVTTFAATIGALLYPVGSYYLNETDATNPASLLGFGTWTAIVDKFIVAHGSTYTSTGGAATVTLAQNNLPSSLSFTAPCTDSDPSEAAGTTHIAKGDISSGQVTATLAFTNSGGGQSFSIIPTYQAAYIWKRTA